MCQLSAHRVKVQADCCTMSAQGQRYFLAQLAVKTVSGYSGHSVRSKNDKGMLNAFCDFLHKQNSALCV